MLKLRVPFIMAAALVAGLVSLPAAAGDSTQGPTYGIKVYEVFQRGPSLELQERTTRAFAPRHVRNLAAGETFPAEGQPAMKVFKSRDSLGFFGSYWREDGASGDYGRYKVEVVDEGPAEESGVELIRVRLVPAERGRGANRPIFHPGRMGGHGSHE